MSKALQIRNGQAIGALNLHRDGDVVTLVAQGEATRSNPHGSVHTRGSFTHQYSSVEAYEYERDKLFHRWPLAYAKFIGRLGVDDDARNAPPLPEDLRHLLPEHARALEDGSTSTSGRASEPRGRPFLLSAPRDENEGRR